MESLARTSLTYKPKGIMHYATYEDILGTAQVLIGTGQYLVKRPGYVPCLVRCTHPQLVLLGIIDLADAQHAADLRAREAQS
jgi:hypothetical protein